MFDSTALAEPGEPGDEWEVTADWPVVMAEGMGPTGAALNLLSGVNPAGISEPARVSALAQLAGIVAHCEAVRARLTGAVAGPAPDDPREDWGVHEVSVASRCSVYAADRQVAFARSLAGRLAATFEALDAGRISYAQARLLSEETAHLTDERALQVEERMLRYAWRQDLTKFKVSLRRWLAKLDPAFAERARRARADVTVEHTANDDGTGGLWVRGPLEFTAAIDTALNAYASHTKSAQGGTAAARKLSGLLEWAEAYLTSPDTPRRRGRAYTVNVGLDAPTIFGLARHPAEIPGYGMIPAGAAINLLANGSPLRRLIIDERDGHLLDYGTKTYLVPPPLAVHLVALHQTSAGPHSSVRADGCDNDHNIPFGSPGGTTDADNVTPLDRRWHRAKTHAGWTYLKNKDGTVDWTSPAGQSHREDPHDYRLGP